MFKVKIRKQSWNSSSHSGKLRKIELESLAGDEVMVDDSYDLTKGRITLGFSSIKTN